MFVAADVHYPPSGGARAALVAANDLSFSSINFENAVFVPEVAPYKSGEFFRRELPPLRVVLIEVVPNIEILIVDGYVDLDPGGRPGLGAYAHEEFGIPVIGVAKTLFMPATHAIPVLRGSATRPLYVTAMGIPVTSGAAIVRAMEGKYRIPDALRRADALARGRQIPNTYD
jgi:deoxyribonuclease V